MVTANRSIAERLDGFASLAMTVEGLEYLFRCVTQPFSHEARRPFVGHEDPP
jgi:hypothetical protein